MVSETSVTKGYGLNLNYPSFNKVECLALDMQRVCVVFTLLDPKTSYVRGRIIVYNIFRILNHQFMFLIELIP